MNENASTLQPTRPLAWIGMETTGIGPATNRIAKIAILRIEPSGTTTNYIRRLNPGAPVRRATPRLRRSLRRGHGKSPMFADIHDRIRELLNGCDLIGYNLTCFAIPFLVAEFERAGSRISFRESNVIEM